MFVVVRGSESNCRKAIRCTIEFVRSMKIEPCLFLWLIHKLDQMRAEQREFDNWQKEKSSNEN